MNKIILIKHWKGAPGLRYFGLGPFFTPCRGLNKLKIFLNDNTSWAKDREINDLKHCLSNSDVIVSLWQGTKILGFGRALSDGIYRAVLWDIVIDENHQGNGYGKLIVSSILKSKKMKRIEKIYCMTSNKKEFYSQMNFEEVISQSLLMIDHLN
mgnify:CR=1 FL=1|tara:strand:+ start:1740 stop:2201 length:462 start_codon:yes stop_codon:yes gene_type:complete